MKNNDALHFQLYSGNSLYFSYCGCLMSFRGELLSKFGLKLPPMACVSGHIDGIRPPGYFFQVFLMRMQVFPLKANKFCQYVYMYIHLKNCLG